MLGIWCKGMSLILLQTFLSTRFAVKHVAATILHLDVLQLEIGVLTFNCAGIHLNKIGIKYVTESSGKTTFGFPFVSPKHENEARVSSGGQQSAQREGFPQKGSPFWTSIRSRSVCCDPKVAPRGGQAYQKHVS